MTWTVSDNPVPLGEISGQCPMGCGETLCVVEGGHVVCHGPECPHPSAVDVLLHQPLEHVVEFSEQGFVVEHPLAERINHTMASCQLMIDLAALPAMPVDKPGRYLATKHQPDGYSESYRGDAIGWDFDPTL
jgi:Family of unknown function (DUF6085)